MERGPRAAEVAERAPKVKELIIALPTLNGDIRFNHKGFFRAHCHDPTHNHGNHSCRRQRQATKGRLGAGRPIGLLVAWLQEANHFDHILPTFLQCQLQKPRDLQLDSGSLAPWGA